MSCEEGYGFLPCSSSVGGSLMLMLGYGYVLLKGAEYISDGSERRARVAVVSNAPVWATSALLPEAHIEHGTEYHYMS